MRPSGKLSTPYDKTFFNSRANGSLRSARAIVPLITDLAKPRSVVDFGCGIGTWLQAFVECGVEDYLGFDGDYVDQSQLRIPAARFRAVDLTHLAPLGRRFDLAVCMEVGEHLPATAALGLVKALTDSAPLVLFSAALPGQGGTNHCNERWSWYWEELFGGQGFVRLDPIRPRVWGDPNVEWWYRQNTFLYAHRAAVGEYPKLSAECKLTQDHPIELVSAYILRRNVSPSLWKLIGMLPRSGVAWRHPSLTVSARPNRPARARHSGCRVPNDPHQFRGIQASHPAHY